MMFVAGSGGGGGLQLVVLHTLEMWNVKEFLYFYLHKPLFPTEIVKS